MAPATEALGLDLPRAAVCSRVEGFTLLGGAPGKTPVLYRSTIGVANGLGHRLPTIGIRRIIAFIEEKALKRLMHFVLVPDGSVVTMYWSSQSAPQFNLSTAPRNWRSPHTRHH